MAEIKIEKKKPMWLWIVLVLLILAGIYIILNDGNTPSENTPEIEHSSTGTTTNN